MKSKEKRIEIIKDKLYWLSSKTVPKNIANAFYFCIDKELTYKPFHSDFGPLDIHKISLFSTELQNLLKNKNFENKKIVHYTSDDKITRTNTALLMGAFMVI